jgi:putative ABC transport system permease protein
MHTWIQDLRYGARILRKTPAFTIVAILTLAIGIGANTAIFSIVDAVLFRPLAMVQPQRVMFLAEVWKGRDGGVSVGNFSDIREQNTVFSSLSASASAAFNLATEDAPERIQGERVTAEYFTTFGVAPLLGRVFTPAEDKPGNDAVVVISERLWRTRFHENPAIAGQTIRVNGAPVLVAGVMPKTFDPLLSKSDIWVPAAFTAAQLADHDNHFLNVFARLKDGVPLSSARSQMSVIAAREQQLHPIDDKDRAFSLTPLTEILLGDQRVTLFTVLGAVGFVLLIACANIANLQLARARGRQKEVAVRVALGATPKRIVRQLLAENMVLSAASAILGVLLAIGGVRWLVANAPAGVPRIDEARVDIVALLFACGIALLSSLIFGMVPALRSAAVRLTEAFNQGAARTTATRDRVRSVLVVGEVALALVLLAGAGLLVRSALLLGKVQPGFDTVNLMVGRVGLSEKTYREPTVARQTFEAILSNVKNLPGVEATAVVSRAPLTSGGGSNGLIAEGKAFDPSEIVDARLRVVSPGYLNTSRVPLKIGRDFTPQDTRDRTFVVLVNETLAHTMWPGQDPIGKRFACCEAGPKGRMDPVWHEVVGVVGDVRAWGLDQRVLPEFYLPIAQMPPDAWDWIGRTMDIVVRTKGTGIPVSELRAAVAKAAPGVPIYSVSTMQERVSSQLEQSHFDTFLLTTFAATALLLAAVGIYGVLSYTVVQRTKDIGVRMALGASQSTIVRDVLGHGLLLTGFGVGIGLVGALVGARLIRSLLYGVRPTDLGTFFVVSLVMAAVALLASYLPARRASRVDPIVALRYE